MSEEMSENMSKDMSEDILRDTKIEDIQELNHIEDAIWRSDPEGIT